MVSFYYEYEGMRAAPRQSTQGETQDPPRQWHVPM
jgi:hypothetical protein